MSSADELCALGFEKYWVTQALELTGDDKECALEWLLSDEFKIAQQQYNTQHNQKKALSNNTIEIEIEIETENKNKKRKKEKEIEIEIEYDLNDSDNPLLSDTDTANMQNKSIEISPNLLPIPAPNTSAPFDKLSTTIVHSNQSTMDYSEDLEMCNMEFIDDNMSMDMSSIQSQSNSMSFATDQYNTAEIIHAEFIENAPKLIYRELKHLKHTYITPIYYNNQFFIVSTKTFNNKNDLIPGIFLYKIKLNEWQSLINYPQAFNLNSHKHVLDNENHMLYIYSSNLEDGSLIVFDIKQNKFIIKRNIVKQRNNSIPRLYQSICAIHIASPINEIHFIANTNTNSNHFRYDAITNNIDRIEMIGLENKNYVMNPKIIYVESLSRLYSFGGYNGSLHRDISFLQYNNILHCDIYSKNQTDYEWIVSDNKLPFKSSIFDVILCFDTILVFFYGKVIYLFDLNLFNDDRQWYKCESVYPLNECYDLQIILDDLNKNIHFIHCTNPLGLSLMPAPADHYRHPSSYTDKPYHIKVSVYDIIPKPLLNKYKIKFPLCLSGIIRTLLNEYTLNTQFNDIPKDIFNIILGYFHPLCLAKCK